MGAPDMAEKSKRSLREKAIERGRGRPGYKSRVDLLLESLNPDERAEVLDLLQGEPLLPHAAVAAVLVETYPDLAGDPIIRDRNVMDWRRARGVRLRHADEG